MKTNTSTAKPKNCVIYTRAKQDSTWSHEFQSIACNEEAQKKGLTVIARFGGPHVIDVKAELDRMLDFVFKNVSQLECILVYSIDRFSRTGSDPIMLIHDLKTQYGIDVVAVNMAPSNSVYGDFVYNLMRLVARMDNAIRTQRSMTGMKKQVEMGLWIGVPKRGYTAVGNGSKRELVINSDGQLLTETFKMKAGKSLDSQIILWLRERGMTISKSALRRIFRDVFYTGHLSSKFFPGKLIKGRHPAIIDVDTFLIVNPSKREIFTS
jgi:DNA invertase Pin-like site-specific DNA recombinase